MERRRRKKIRLKNYDYSQNGAYFVTICTQNREMLFGDVVDGEMVYSDLGKIAVEEIEHTNIQRRKDDIFISNYVVMPNHVHFIVNIVGTRLAVSTKPQFEAFSKPTAKSLSSVIRSYKSAVTKRIRETAGGHGKPCPYVIWQSRYYEHIIRNEDDFLKISEYIVSNPYRWEEDRFYTKG
ncbi:MAG: hypothetical protein IJZ95_08230 [Oscillospiraceae bacterium]|nr:hypothetical protein [Oscillospiraceae bacterium]